MYKVSYYAFLLEQSVLRAGVFLLLQCTTSDLDQKISMHAWLPSNFSANNYVAKNLVCFRSGVVSLARSREPEFLRKGIAGEGENKGRSGDSH